MANIGYIGLGTMGAPMAGHLAAAGHDVTVFNRTTERAVAWSRRHRGTVAATPADAARGAAAVFVCVGGDDDVRSVALGPNGVLSALAPGTVLVDHPTASATLARALDRAAGSAGVGFVDAPVSGGQSGAEAGALTVMCGGSDEAYGRAAPLIASYARRCRLIGPAGAGQLTKMVNQIAIAGLLQSLAEALDFGVRSGLDMDAVLDVVSAGAAGSWQMENRAAAMLADHFDFGFAVEWMRKDLGICIDEGDRVGAELSVTRLVDGYYAELVARGGARWDTSSLIRRLDR